MNVSLGRRAFLRSLFGGKGRSASPSVKEPLERPEEKGTVRVLSELYGAAVETVLGKPPAEPDYEALLPADFTPALLRMEAIRLGLDPDTLDRQALAREVLRAMGALPDEKASQT